jgi:hypothetical protein
MPSFKAKDASGITRDFRSTGAGSEGDPFIPDHGVMGQYNATLTPLGDGQAARLRMDNAGGLLVNPGFYNSDFIQAGVIVTTTSALLLPVDPERTYVLIQNTDPLKSIWLKFVRSGDLVATANYLSLELKAGAVFFEKGDLAPRCEIQAITDSGTVNVHITRAS